MEYGEGSEKLAQLLCASKFDTAATCGVCMCVYAHARVCVCVRASACVFVQTCVFQAWRGNRQIANGTSHQSVGMYNI